MAVFGEGTLFARFRLLRLLGAGGAGEVHLASDESSGRIVALKILAEEAASDEFIRASFEKEARLSLDLVHPNLVRCLRADVTAKRPWIAFEYVEGNSLADVLEAKGTLDPWLAADVILDVALGLAAAHQKGVLHQDIKPHNVLLTGDGTIKLIDFGAASADRLPSEDYDPAFDLAPSALDDEGGAVAFSLHYASPEQLQGREVGPESDLYSLGLVFYELLTGESLIESDSKMGVIMEHMSLRGGFPAPSSKNPMVARSLDELVQSLLVFDRDERPFEDALSLSRRLERILAAAGHGTVHRRSQRLLARLGLAETDCERAERLLRRDRLVEAMLVFDSLLDLPSSVSTAYRDHVCSRLRTLLLKWHRRILCDEGGPAFHDAVLAVLPRVAHLARRTEDADLLRLVERRCATMAERILEPDDRLDWLQLLESSFPDSPHLGALEMTTRIERDEDEALPDALAFVDRLLDEGRVDQARSICLDLRRHLPDAAGPATRLDGVERLRRHGDDDRQAAQEIIDRALSREDDEGAALACETYVNLHPDDTMGWEQLADLQVRRGDEVGGVEALRRGARTAFDRGDLFVAHALFTRILGHDRRDDESAAFLYEILASRGLVLRSPRTIEQFRIATLLFEGLEDVAIAETEGRLDGSDGDGPFLRIILEIADEAGSRALASTVHLHLGERAMTEGNRAAAREHFGRALATSPSPQALLTRLVLLPFIHDVLSPEELRGLAERAAKKVLKDGLEDVDP